MEQGQCKVKKGYLEPWIMQSNFRGDKKNRLTLTLSLRVVRYSSTLCFYIMWWCVSVNMCLYINRWKIFCGCKLLVSSTQDSGGESVKDAVVYLCIVILVQRRRSLIRHTQPSSCTHTVWCHSSCFICNVPLIWTSAGTAHEWENCCRVIIISLLPHRGRQWLNLL